MAAVDTVLAASHPYLACPPWAETTVNGLGWLLYAQCILGGIKAAMEQQVVTMVEKCIWWLILVVFFV